MNPTINLTRTIQRQCAFICALLLLSCAGLSAAPKHTGHAGVRFGHRASKCDLNGGHIFLYVQGGTCVDVTNTLTTVNGQNYITYQGNQIAVVLNLTNGTVLNLNNNVIGVIGSCSSSS